MPTTVSSRQPWAGRARALMAVVLIASLAVFAAPAAAAPPDHSDYASSGDVMLNDYCAFPLHIVYVQTGRQSFFYDQNGALVRIEAHVVEQDTFSANGHALQSVPFTLKYTLRFDSAGNLIQYVSNGAVVRVRLPDGTMFTSAGKVNWLDHPGATFIIDPDRGTPVNRDRFCATLAP